MKLQLQMWVAAMVLSLLIVSGCSTVPVTGRSQLNLVSAGQETQLGLSSFDQLKKETPISRDPALNAMVQRVGKRIAAVAAKDMPDAQWEFVVFDSKEANAFCLPGGKVGVYTGILPITRDDAGLATVIGHEVGHAVAHHGSERMSEAMVMQEGQQLLGSTLTSTDPRLQQAALLAYGAGAQLGRELPHSRKQELEADQIGLTYMARAGYDPRAALDFWKRFSEYNQQQGGGTPSGLARFLSTHPVDSVRIEQIEKLLPQAEAEFAHSKTQ
jgi:predicted Zn-dependent protease